MVHLPVATQTEDTKQKYTVIEMKSTEHHTGLTDATDDFFWYTLSDDTDGADDTDDTDDREEVWEIGHISLFIFFVISV